jgi:hypothetical protein
MSLLAATTTDRRLPSSLRVICVFARCSHEPGPPSGRTTSLNQVKQQLVAWYQENQRPLPWRETTDPYEILVSEIMLQQTQVAEK